MLSKSCMVAVKEGYVKVEKPDPSKYYGTTDVVVVVPIAEIMSSS